MLHTSAPLLCKNSSANVAWPLNARHHIATIRHDAEIAGTVLGRHVLGGAGIVHAENPVQRALVHPLGILQAGQKVAILSTLSMQLESDQLILVTPCLHEWSVFVPAAGRCN
jgi:hypothetical protein